MRNDSHARRTEGGRPIHHLRHPKCIDSLVSPRQHSPWPAGGFLYVQGGKEGTVNEFEVQGNGSLKSLGPAILVPVAEGGEGIVAG